MQREAPVARHPRWRNRAPAHLVNGASVAIGVALVHTACAVFAGAPVAQIATGGAVCASLADGTGTSHGTWRRVLAAGALGWLASTIVWLLQTHPVALGLAIGAIAFVAMMTMAWGQRAGPISFAPLLAIVFTMSLPPEAQSTLEPIGWDAAGVLGYLLWSRLSTSALQRVYRTRALLDALEATARLFRARADLLESPAVASEAALQPWIGDETRLADRLQSARDLLFTAPDSPLARRETALLLRTIDLRDVLLASRLDLDLLGDDAGARAVRGRVAGALRRIAAALDACIEALQTGRAARFAWADPEAGERLVAASVLDATLAPEDPRARLLPAFTARLQRIESGVRAIAALAAGEHEAIPLSREQLRLFAAPDAWPPGALRAHFSVQSPVFRHAIRMALALAGAYFIARVLPWASHPHWLVLGVAVVLRGTLEQTLSRRNERVSGTVVGCVLVLLLGHSQSRGLMELSFFIGVGIAHAFVTVRYRVTAVAATVMALLQAYLVDPGVPLAVVERLSDTLLGALLAWAFSYVLPSWERRGLPASIERALAALGAYARHSLRTDPRAAVEQRMARRAAYDALGAIAGALQRSRAEPRSVRPPSLELSTMIDAGQRLMAHLSVIRMSLALRGETQRTREVAAAMHSAHESLQHALDPARPSDAMATAAAARALECEAPPRVAPEADPAAWLLRRLRIATADAWAVRSSADDALARLGEEWVAPQAQRR